MTRTGGFAEDADEGSREVALTGPGPGGADPRAFRPRFAGDPGRDVRPAAGQPGPGRDAERAAEEITWKDFEKVDMRVGVVRRAEPFPQARQPAYRLWIDFGPLGEKRASAQITDHYRPDELIGRQVICVVNFPPKQIGPFVSEVLVLGAYIDGRQVILLRPDRDVDLGSRIG